MSNCDTIIDNLVHIFVKSAQKIKKEWRLRMSKISKVCKWGGVSVMAAALTVGMLTAEATPVSAAKKVKSIKVTASNSVLGSFKTIYVKGPKNVKSTKLKVTVKPAKASKKVTYKSSKKKVATVSKSGKVTAKKVGKTTITVTSKSNKKVKKTIKITVKKYTYPTSMAVSASKTTLNGGETAQLTASFAPATTSVKNVTYSSSDATLATVSADGVVTANSTGKAGTVKITATAVSQTKDKKTLSKTVSIEIKGKAATGGNGGTTTPTDPSKPSAPTEAPKPTAEPTAAPTTAPEPTVAPTDAPVPGPVQPESIKFQFSSVTIKMNGTAVNPTTKLRTTVTPSNAEGEITFTSSNEDVATIAANGTVTGKSLGTTIITASFPNGVSATCEIIVTANSLSIHDPSVYKDPISGLFYTFGSHLVAGVSSDLIGWKSMGDTSSGYAATTGMFTKNYKEEFAEAYAFTMPNGANENAWAPDIVYNKAMEKYCMYMTIVDGSKKCCIAMASSDNPDGPYEYQGMIVCSGILPTDIEKTNVAEALGISEQEAVASKYATIGTNSPDCIDATVFYDKDNNLWMVYGSFTTAGGIRLLKLDPATGLRGTNYEESEDATETTLGDADPYYGLKIANNNGEGPFIQEIADESSPTGYYYYLWTSVGGLQSYGGYNMRLVRATDVEGPYYDPQGNLATSSLGRAELGLRVIDNYKFSFMDVAYTSCGGNSAVMNDEGKTFIHFHQKFANGGESFLIRTHQTFMNEEGWLVTAPFEYNGETIADSYTKEQVVGAYEFIYHRTTYGRTGTEAYDYVESQRLELNADETVSGSHTGTWELDGHYITITIGGKTYKGVVLEQYEQTDAREKVMVFTAIGSDNRTLWGSKMHKTDAESVDYDASRVNVVTATDENFTVPTSGLFGSTITWESDSNVIVIENGNATVTRPDVDTTVKLTATIKKGEATKKKTYSVKVSAYEIVVPSMIEENLTLTLPRITAQGTVITWSSSNTNVIDVTTGNVVAPTDRLVQVELTATYGDVTKTFIVRVGAISFIPLYNQDYQSALATADVGWTTHGALTSTIVTDGDNKYSQFVSTGSGPRSGMQTLGVNTEALTSTYAISTDFAVTTASYSGSGIPTTQIALVGDASTVNATGNSITDSDCIVDLQAYGHAVQTFTVNGNADATADIPAGVWCNLKVTIDKEAKQAFVMITNKDTEEEIYSGAVTFAGSGNIKGIYILNGRGGTNVKFDNTQVLVVE